ncbi:MAG: ParB/RepB/Spo0J family partition protein [Candidatus Neomarinimicrobiota bacterium]|nr:ParB/RepB/Spo0J family partition protein [Candidatus Neomarinimicrobiota bacterium]
MATKRLGKGLEALIRSDHAVKKEHISHSGVTQILLSKIKTNPYQPRKEFNKDALSDLASSIKQKGVISPITVCEEGNGYILIAGERRLRASKLIKLKEIPAYIMEVKNDSDMMQIALIENIQRENLNPMEESEAYALLNNQFKLSQKDIAKSVGKNRSTITNSLRLLQLPSEIRKSLKHDKISAGHARAILSMSTKTGMLKLWKMILKDGLSVRSAEKVAKGSAKIKSAKTKSLKTKSKSIRSLEDELILILGTKVNLNARGSQSGSISIEYFTHDDLERILELLRSIDN